MPGVVKAGPSTPRNRAHEGREKGKGTGTSELRQTPASASIGRGLRAARFRLHLLGISSAHAVTQRTCSAVPPALSPGPACHALWCPSVARLSLSPAHWPTGAEPKTPPSLPSEPRSLAQHDGQVWRRTDICFQGPLVIILATDGSTRGYQTKLTCEVKESEGQESETELLRDEKMERNQCVIQSGATDGEFVTAVRRGRGTAPCAPLEMASGGCGIAAVMRRSMYEAYGQAGHGHIHTQCSGRVSAFSMFSGLRNDWCKGTNLPPLISPSVFLVFSVHPIRSLPRSSFIPG